MDPTKFKVSLLIPLVFYFGSVYAATSPDALPGGPSSVPGTVREDSAQKAPLFFPHGIFDLKSYEAFKARLKREYGFTPGMDFNLLYQYANPSPGESDALGVVVRFFGEWKPKSISTDHPGALVYKIEYRHSLGTEIAPQQLAGEVGYAGLTAITYSDVGFLLSNLYWTQNFNHNQFAYVVGQVDVSDYFDIYGLVNPWTEFNNLAFSIDPTIPAPNQGLGAALRVTVKNNYYILLGLSDANGNPEDPLDGFNTFFKEREYFKYLELGWADSWEARFTNNIHLDLWNVDERVDANIPAGRGVALSFSRNFGRWLPFLRIGYGDGGGEILDRSISTGFGYDVKGSSDRFGLGLNWGQPNSEIYTDSRENQYTLELYYRMQVFKRLQITPDIQLLLNPALNPDEDQVWVLSLRARFAL